MEQVITRDLIELGMTFDKYMALTKSIIESNFPEGLYAKESTLRYTRSNWERMNKVLNNTVITQRLYNLLSDLKEEWVWLVISEPWCGDASWGVPALSLMASCSDKIEMRIILRDAHMTVMEAYQTNGSNSIPKLICLKKKNLKEMGTWGPRPAALHELVMKWKNEPGADFKENVRQLHAWFDADMSKSIDAELSILVKQWKEI